MGDINYLIDSIELLDTKTKDLETTTKRLDKVTAEYDNSTGELRESLGKQITKLSALQATQEGVVKYQKDLVEAEKADIGVRGKLVVAIDKTSKSLTSGRGVIASMSQQMPMLHKGIMGVSAGFKALIANPIGATLAAVVIVFKGLQSAIGKSEQQTMMLKNAFAVFNPIIDGVKNAISALAGVLVNTLNKVLSKIPSLLDKISTMAKNIGLDTIADQSKNLADQMRAAQKLQEEGNKLILEKRKLEEDVAKREAEISNKRLDSYKVTGAQRKKLLEEVQALELLQFEDKVKIAEKELEILEEESKRTESNGATLQALAEARTAVYQAQTEYNNKLSQTQKQITKLGNTENKNAKDEKKNTAQKIKDQQRYQKELLDLQIENAEKYSDEWAELQNKKLTAEYERAKESAALEIENEDTRLKTIKELDIKYNNDKNDIIREQIENAEKYSDEWVELQNKKLTAEYERAKELATLEIENEDTKLETIKELDIKYNNDKNDIIREQFEYKKQLRDKDLEDAKKITEIELQIYDSMANNMISTLNNLGGEQGKYKEQIKIIQAGQIAVDTAVGANAAFTTAQTLGPVAGPIVGGVNAGLVIANGLSQLVALRSETIKSTPGSSGASQSAYVAPQIHYEGGGVLRTETAVVNGKNELQVVMTDKQVTDASTQVEVRNKMAKL